mgnify:CR=1 FL=1
MTTILIFLSEVLSLIIGPVRSFVYHRDRVGFYYGHADENEFVWFSAGQGRPASRARPGSRGRPGSKLSSRPPSGSARPLCK